MGRDTRRRWLAVAVGVALLVSLPMIAHAIPARAASISLDTLVARIAGSASQPYQGYAVSTASVGLPSLPQLNDVTSLFDGDTSLRIWYASPTRWRVDTIDTAGERDLYTSAAGETIWDSGQNQITTILGSATVRLPRGADLAPPDFARRMLSAATAPALAPARGPASGAPTPGANGGSTRTGLPARRIAGVDAAGVRLTPNDSRTTVAHVDIWADPATGLPLEVAVSARGVAAPVLVSRMLEVRLTAPPTGTTAVPVPPAGVGYTVTENPNVLTALRSLGLGTLPDTLAGARRSDSGLGALPGIGAYGTGFHQFIAANVPGRTGYEAFRAARNVGGAVRQFDGGRGVIVTTPLISVLIGFSERTRIAYIVVGLVGPDVLTTVGAQLAAYTGPDE